MAEIMPIRRKTLFNQPIIKILIKSKRVFFKERLNAYKSFITRCGSLHLLLAFCLTLTLKICFRIQNILSLKVHVLKLFGSVFGVLLEDVTSVDNV